MYKLGKRKPFGLLQSEEYLPRINLFWTSVKDFVDTWFQVILWSFVRWSWSYFVSAHIRELKTGWLIAIWRLYASDQCFLDFGEGFRGYLISLNFTKFCSQKLLTLCFSTLGNRKLVGLLPSAVFKHIFYAYFNFKSVRGPLILLFLFDPRTFKPTVS